jgi:hypothetical protein
MLWNRHIHVVIQNNIFFYPSRFAVVGYTAKIDRCLIQFNLIAGPAAVYRGSDCSIGINQVGVDPMFVNPASHNYRLRAGSPAVGAGANISLITRDLTGAIHPIFIPFGLGVYQPDPVHPLSADRPSP